MVTVITPELGYFFGVHYQHWFEGIRSTQITILGVLEDVMSYSIRICNGLGREVSSSYRGYGNSSGRPVLMGPLFFVT